MVRKSARTRIKQRKKRHNKTLGFAVSRQKRLAVSIEVQENKGKEAQ
jgi:hypothetical protein